MNEFKSDWRWGGAAIAIYVVVVALVFGYFNYKQTHKIRHYVVKNDDRIQVALASAAKPPVPKPLPRKRPQKKQPSKPKPKPKTHNKIPKKPTTKPVPTRKPKVKRTKPQKVAKAKPIKRIKKRDTNRTNRRKTPSTKSLFASVKTPKKVPIVVSKKPIKPYTTKQLFTMVDAKVRSPQDSMKKQQRKDKGVTNAYLAKVQRMLEDWPSQSDFAGERVKVYLKIRPDGHFTFEFKQKANNPAFNEALRSYLEQLQSIGFGPHLGKRTYLFEAEFVAKG